MLHRTLQYHKLRKKDPYNPCVEFVKGRRDCINCTGNDIENVKRLELSYCMGCLIVPNYIPAEQIRQYIRKKYYGE